MDPLTNTTKESGVCSACLSVRQLDLKDGNVHVHRPRPSRCPGSDKPPLQSDGNHAADHDIAISVCSKTNTNTAPTCTSQSGAAQPEPLQPGLKPFGSPSNCALQSDQHTLLLTSQPSNIFSDLPVPHAHAIWRAFFVALSAAQPKQLHATCS